jgi:hypothetical protein
MKHDDLLQEYLNGIKLLDNIVSNLSKDQILFIPLFDNAWSIQEHVIHIVESEINNFIRWRSILAQPNSKCFVIEEDNWNKNLNYQQEDICKYLNIFKLLRTLTYDYLKTVEESKWNQNYFIHEYHGDINKITLEQNIEIYAKHVYSHIEYIERNISFLRKM